MQHDEPTPAPAELSPEQQQRLDVILKDCTVKQRAYIGNRVALMNVKDAADAAGVVPSTVQRWPAYINEAIELLTVAAVFAAKSMLQSAVIKAALVKIGGLDSDDELVKQRAATEILDRVLGKAVEHKMLGGSIVDALAIKTYEKSAEFDPDDV